MERANFTLLVYLLVPVNLFIASQTPKRFRFLYAVFQLGLYFAIVLLVPPGSVPSSDYTFGTTFYSVLAAFNFFFFCDPYEEHWQIAPEEDKIDQGRDRSRQSSPVKYKDLDLRASVLWCISNAFALRGIGWNWRIPHLPPGPTRGISRVPYLIDVGTTLLKLYLLHDFSATLLEKVTLGGQLPLENIRLDLRTVAVVSFAVSSITLIEFGYQIICFAGAATGLFWTRFQDNHPVIGSVYEGYTIGRFWGRVWHQNMRRILQAPGKYLAQKVLHVKRGGLVSRYVQSYTAFFLSGVYHYIGAKSSLPHEQLNRTCWFFLLQPNLMLIEDFALWFGKEKLGLKSPRWTCLGYVWTFVMLTVTAAGFVDDCIRHQLVPPTSAFSFSLAALLIQKWEL